MNRHPITLTISSLLLTGTLLSGCAAAIPMPASAPTGESGSAGSSWGDAATADSAADSEAAPSEESAVTSSMVRPTSPAAEGRGAESSSRPAYGSQYEPVTAGVVDDNAAWDEYLNYRDRHRRHGAREIDVSRRIVINVVDERGLPVHDATVEIHVGERPVFLGRTDTAGRVLFPPNAVAAQRGQSGEFRVVATKQWAARSQTFDRSAGDVWTMVIEDAPRAEVTQLDLLFLIDATGSMDDEIDKLKASMADIADEIARLPERPDVRYGLVAYRDHGDEFVVRNFDFTANLGQFQQTLLRLEANGGGDEPEALDEAFHTTVHDVKWRADDTVRMVVLVADAPPHTNAYGNETYDVEVFDAVAQGIKVFPVGASGLSGVGEYVFRQLAQITGGKFVFLTYEDGSDPSSGPGTETDHDVENYSVNTLDRLIVRLVREELAALTQQVGADAQPTREESTGLLSTLRCEVMFDDAGVTSNCPTVAAAAASDAIQLLESGLLKIRLDPQIDGFRRARFDIDFGEAPIGYSVNIGDSVSNNGDGGDDGDQSNDAEVQIIDDTLAIFAGDGHLATGSERMLGAWHGIAQAGSTVSMEIEDGKVWVDGLGTITSPNLFALAGQQDDEGPVNYDIYAAFNRNITGERRGLGVDRVTVTLFAAEQ
jgi:Mg-chelatase subunit ChlD